MELEYVLDKKKRERERERKKREAKERVKKIHDDAHTMI